MLTTRSVRVTSPLLVSVLLAACGDGALAPDREPTRFDGQLPNAKITVTFMAPDSTSADFTVTQTGGWFQLGKHAIFFPKRAICDPERSTYGPKEWDKPCVVLTRPVNVHAEIRKLNDYEWVDFTPALRFVPSKKPHESVWLYLRTPAAVGIDDDQEDAGDEGETVKPTILWSPAIGQPGIDESPTDPSVKTFVYEQYGIAYRRIKHFSGYNVYAGRIASHESEYDDDMQ
jgi:hypothetical protein